MHQYQKEQLEALQMIRKHLAPLSASALESLETEIADYLSFRSRVAEFLEVNFTEICTEKCYHSRLSACCSKDGIIAFFADAAVNALVAKKADLDRLEQAILHPEKDFKCIFLSDTGCLWQVKPIVCEMFLCDEAEQKAFSNNPDMLSHWENLKQIKKSFTWPDRPVLFEKLEAFFMEKGCRSPLMYIHTSPGLLRIKNNREERTTK